MEGATLFVAASTRDAAVENSRQNSSRLRDLTERARHQLGNDISGTSGLPWRHG
jgi:hypothetical protein